MIPTRYPTAQIIGTLSDPTSNPMPHAGIRITTISHGITPTYQPSIVFTDNDGRYSFYLVKGTYEISVNFNKNWKTYGKLEILDSDIQKVYPIHELIARYDKDHTEESINSNPEQFKQFALDLLYPVGSIYASMVKSPPTDRIGGEWVLIEPRYLKAADDLHPAGFKGGIQEPKVYPVNTENPSINLTEGSNPPYITIYLWQRIK